MRDGMSAPDLRHVTTLAVKIVFTRQTDPHAPVLGRSFGHPDTYKTGLFSRSALSGYIQIKEKSDYIAGSYN